MHKIILFLLLLALAGCSKKEKNFVLQPLDKVVQAAEQGRVEAQLEIANRYCNGAGIDVDVKEAIKWYTKAANLGNAEAQTCLACCYFLGMGVTQDATQGATWLRKATDQKSPLAELVMAFCHERGVGARHSSLSALHWAKRSAEHGPAISLFIVGRMYASPFEGDPNVKEAVKWFQKTSDQQASTSLLSIPKPIAAFCDIDSDSVGEVFGPCYTSIAADYEQERNLTEAKKWYQRAALIGDKTAITALVRLNSK